MTNRDLAEAIIDRLAKIAGASRYERIHEIKLLLDEQRDQSDERDSHFDGGGEPVPDDASGQGTEAGDASGDMV